MKRFIYLLIDEDANIHVAYDREDLAKKLLSHVSKKVKKQLTIKKVRLNPDLASIK